MKEVIPNVYTFTGLLVGRAYLIEDIDGLTVIDSGLPLAANRIIEQIEAMGYGASEVQRILVTHAHADHVGGLARLKELTAARVFASRIERSVIEGEAPMQQTLPERLSALLRMMPTSQTMLKGTPVDLELEGGETLSEVMGGLRVVSTPGHSPGHLSFWQPERRILFCGDVIVRRLGELKLPYAFVTLDMDENKRSVRKLADLEAAKICFGHGAPLVENAAQQIRSFASKVEVT